MVKGPEIWFRYIESSLNRGFVKPREFRRNLLGRIQRTRHLVRYTGKFVILEVCYIEILLYITEGNILRSKCDWYEHGEKSSKYFLNLEKRNKAKSTISKSLCKSLYSQILIP